ncbi:hypothetical protein [Kitasatospora sp. NPDC004289]
MPDTITPTDVPITGADTTEGPEQTEAEPHPDFVMPLPEPGDAQAAVVRWCDRIAARARAAYPDEKDARGNVIADRWLERARYPGPTPTQPLDTGEARPGRLHCRPISSACQKAGRRRRHPGVRRPQTHHNGRRAHAPGSADTAIWRPFMPAPTITGSGNEGAHMQEQEAAAAAVRVLVESVARGGAATGPEAQVIALVRERLGRTETGRSALLRLDTERSAAAEAAAATVLAGELAADAVFGHLIRTTLDGREPSPAQTPPVPPPPPYPPSGPSPDSPGPLHETTTRPRPAPRRVAAVWLLGIPQVLLAFIAGNLAAEVGAPSLLVGTVFTASAVLLALGIRIGATTLRQTPSPLLVVGVVVDALLMVRMFLALIGI